MKIAMIMPTGNFLEDLIPHLKKLGVDILMNDCSEDCDFMVVWSISVMETAFLLKKTYPTVPMINYNWDVYEWTRTHPRGYDWEGYGFLMEHCVEVWTQSTVVNKRIKEYYDIDNFYVIKTFSRLFDPTVKVEDKRFVINVMRRQPDRNLDWFERAVAELDIPSFSPNHQWGEAEFKEKLATCSFLVCPFYEASTGGLTLIEAYRFGKPVLVSDSPYMGAKEYFGDKANYFKYDDFEDFKKQLKAMWDNTPVLNVAECREFTEQYKSEVMAYAIHSRLKELKNGV